MAHPGESPTEQRGVRCQGPCRCDQLAVSSHSALLLLKASFLIRVLLVWKTRLDPDMPVSSEDAATERSFLKMAFLMQPLETLQEMYRFEILKLNY